MITFINNYYEKQLYYNKSVQDVSLISVQDAGIGSYNPELSSLMKII